MAPAVVSANLARRHLSKGQRAMAVAMLHPEPAALKRKGAGSIETIEQGGVSQQRLSHARTVLAVLPKVAPLVLDGTMPLDAAYREALRIKSA